MPVWRDAPFALSWVVAFGLGAGCSPRASHRQPLPAEVKSPNAKLERSATWEYRPLGPVRPAFELDLGGGGRLAFDALGGRTLSTSDSDQSGAVAPEPLTGATLHGGALYGLGASGVVYIAASPLGPWQRGPAAPQALVSSGIARETDEFLGISADGQLWVSRDLGKQWTPDRSPLFFSALKGGGATLFLQSLPEAYFSWRPGRGLEPLPQTFGGGPFDRGADGRWGVRASDGLHALESALPAAPLGAALQPTRFIRPAQLREGKGSLHPGGAVTAFVAGEDGTYRLWSGIIESSLSETSLSLPCEAKQVAQGGEHLYSICEDRGKNPSSFEFFGSKSGAPFESLGSGLRGSGESLRVRAAGGVFAFSGFCPPIENEPGCDPRGLFWAELEGEGSVQVPIPEGRMPITFDFAGDGSLWTLAIGPRDQHLILHRAMVRPDSVSAVSDRGPKLESRIALRSRGSPRFEIASLDLTDLFHLSPVKMAELFPSEGSVVGVAIGESDGTMTFAFDSNLHAIGFGRVPGPVTSIGGVGERLLALHEPSRRIFETKDAGLSWRRSDLPNLPGPRKEPLAVYCAEVGCLVGEELFRSGFGSDLRVNVPSARDGNEGAELSGLALAPIECQADASTRFFLEGAASRPTAHDAARGDVLWSQVASRPKDGSAWAYHARFAERQVDRTPLFPRSNEASRLALSVSEQVEGSAALRFRIKKGQGSRLAFDKIEVAWDNRILGHTCFGTVPFELMGSGLDYENRPGAAARGKPSLLTVSGDTLYVELAASSQEGGALFAVDECGQTHRTITIPPVPASDLLTEREFVREGEVDIFLRLSRDGWLVSGTSNTGRSRVMRLAGIPERQDLVYSVHLGYLGTEARFTTVIADGDGRFWRGESLPIRGLLEPMPPRPDRVPLLSDVQKLRACTGKERAGSVRVVSPAFPRGERSVVVKGLAEPIPLVVGRAVVQGTLGSPCVSTLEAVSGLPGITAGAADSEYGVLVDLDPGAVSWLFEDKKLQGERAVSAFALDCRIREADAASLQGDGARAHDESDPE